MSMQAGGPRAPMIASEDDGPAGLLLRINTWLEGRGLQPLPHLGGQSEDEPVITGVMQVTCGLNEYLTEVVFQMRMPNGDTREQIVHYNNGSIVHHGVIAVVLLNDRLVVMRQYRVPVMRWTYELPRGFPHINELTADSPDKGVTITKRLLERELGHRLMRKAKVTETTRLGTVLENTGTSAMELEVFLVRMTADQQEVQYRQAHPEGGLEMHLWNAGKTRGSIGRRLRDGHTLSALMEFQARDRWLW